MVRKTRVKKKPVPPPIVKLPFGNSYLDLLPDDVVETICRMKHQLEFKETVELLKKLSVGLAYDIFEVRIPIKKLLSIATKKKLIYVNVWGFDGRTEASYDATNYETMKKQFNASKVVLHRGVSFLNQLEIKMNEKRNFLVYEILYLLHMLGITKDLDRDIVNILIDDLARTSIISFEIAR
jgi:hypothetical protein